MLKSSHPVIDRFIQFFYLPDCYREIITDREFKKSGKKSRLEVAYELLILFFSYRTFPNHYKSHRLWEGNKSQWKYYFGDELLTFQRSSLSKTVEPREYEILFDDKAVCDLLCKGIGLHNNLPHTYGIISSDQNYRDRIRSWFDDQATDSLIIKPLRGHAGRDIVLAKKVDGTIMIRSKANFMALEDFTLTKPAIVQEVIKQDATMASFSSSSVNTIRVLTMYTKDESVLVLAASMLIGVGDSYVSNWSSGGIGLGVDTVTGRLMRYAYDKRAIRYAEHPTSRVRFEGFQVPHWSRIITLATTIQKAVPCYRLLGIDFAIREDGEPIVIEINANPDTYGQEQSCGPLLENEHNLRAFGEYDLLVNRHQREIYQMQKRKLD